MQRTKIGTREDCIRSMMKLSSQDNETLYTRALTYSSKVGYLTYKDTNQYWKTYYNNIPSVVPQSGDTEKPTILHNFLQWF